MRALLNQSRRQRAAEYPMRHLEDPKTAINFSEANHYYEKSNECLVVANNYLSHGLKEEADKALDDAISHSRRAVSHFVNFREAYKNIASACFLKGDFNRVVEVCQEIERVEPEMPEVHFYWARALFNLAVQAGEARNSENEVILLTEAISEAQKEVSVSGAGWQIVAVLTQVFALKVKILSESILRAGLDSSEAQILRETLDCQIVCAEKLHEIQPTHDTVRMLKELREIRLKLQPSTAQR